MACLSEKCTPEEREGLCAGHTRHLASMIGDIQTFHLEAHSHLLPTASGDGGGGHRKGEITLGVNVAALSFINANDIYIVLGGWERVIRSERDLTPAGLLPPVPGVDAEVDRLVEFHSIHLSWSATQPWADAFYAEVRTLHGGGMAAARAFVERHTRIHCPGEDRDGLPCRAFLSLNPDDPLAPLTCRGCGREWTTLRLVAVAQADRTRPLWVDVETAAHLLGKSASQIRRVARKVHGERSRGQLVNLHALSDFYAA